MSFNVLPSRLKRSLRSFKRRIIFIIFRFRSWKFNDKNLRSRRSSRILRSSFKAINSGSFFQYALDVFHLMLQHLYALYWFQNKLPAEFYPKVGVISFSSPISLASIISGKLISAATPFNWVEPPLIR